MPCKAAELFWRGCDKAHTTLRIGFLRSIASRYLLSTARSSLGLARTSTFGWWPLCEPSSNSLGRSGTGEAEARAALLELPAACWLLGSLPAFQSRGASSTIRVDLGLHLVRFLESWTTELRSRGGKSGEMMDKLSIIWSSHTLRNAHPSSHL